MEILFKTRHPRTAFEIKVGNYLPTKYLNINLGNQFVSDLKTKNPAILVLKYINLLKIFT